MAGCKVINIEYDEYRNKWSELNRLEKTFDFNHDEYISVDAAVPFAGALSDDEIITSVLQSNLFTPEPEPDEVEQEEAYPKVTNREAIKSFECLKMFLMQCSEDRSASLLLLEGIEKDLEVKKAQSRITNFFSA